MDQIRATFEGVDVTDCKAFISLWIDYMLIDIVVSQIVVS